jgi:hypothetical protein
MREWSKDARYTENEKTGYESISPDHAITAFISFRCLKAKKKKKSEYTQFPDIRLNLINSSRTVI